MVVHLGHFLSAYIDSHLAVVVIAVVTLIGSLKREIIQISRSDDHDEDENSWLGIYVCR